MAGHSSPGQQGHAFTRQSDVQPDEQDPKHDRHRLELKSKVGEGAFCSVYRGAFDTRAEAVAVKVLRPHGGASGGTYEEARRLFFREAQMLRRCQHRNIVGFVALCKLTTNAKNKNEAGRRWALVLELMKDGSLAKTLCAQMTSPRTQLYSDAQALDWCADVASALAYLHARRPAVIHRDIKLANVLLAREAASDGGGGSDAAPSTPRLVAKLSDFGLYVTAYPDRSFTAPRAPPLAPPPEPDAAAELEVGAAAAANGGGGKGARISNGGGGDNGGSGDDESGAVMSARCMDAAPSMATDASLVFEDGDDDGGGDRLAPSERQQPPLSPAEQACQLYDLTGRTGSAMAMAPEVFLQQPYNAKADVFSFGVLAFELFSRGMLLFTELPTCASSPDVTEAYATRVAAGYRPARPRAMHESVWRLVSDCWAQDPSARPSMAQVLARLAELRSEIVDGDGGGMSGGGSPGCSCSIM